jgi:hypothetical protein
VRVMARFSGETMGSPSKVPLPSCRRTQLVKSSMVELMFPAAPKP